MSCRGISRGESAMRVWGWQCVPPSRRRYSRRAAGATIAPVASRLTWDAAAPHWDAVAPHWDAVAPHWDAVAPHRDAVASHQDRRLDLPARPEKSTGH